MERNEIRKALYKEKPMATFKYIRKGVAYYDTFLLGGKVIKFEIPVSDMGESDFFFHMEAKLLQRWISNADDGIQVTDDIKNDEK